MYQNMVNHGLMTPGQANAQFQVDFRAHVLQTQAQMEAQAQLVLQAQMEAQAQLVLQAQVTTGRDLPNPKQLVEISPTLNTCTAGNSPSPHRVVNPGCDLNP